MDLQKVQLLSRHFLSVMLAAKPPVTLQEADGVICTMYVSINASLAKAAPHEWPRIKDYMQQFNEELEAFLKCETPEQFVAAVVQKHHEVTFEHGPAEQVG